ncbi:polysaccharide biosynthesis protein [Adhaeribacter arboris]|uniref:Polysaccharide biosynthesis protein n=1 Tax=Adhaeribacter arboris TaxID=2072846 RepID=A0A2T2YMC0_9BACT|nr:lipopolysaccharide biosynthesis protein [Adhaeribacter arboris]PSR56654.1 polysaccharide biosynthesis protein [Adhaeribacter arboris]
MQGLLKKLGNMHFLSLLGNGSMSVINMVTVALLYRSLPIADNGIWIFYQTATLFIDTFRHGILNTAFIKFYAGATKARAEEVIGSTWFLAVSISGFFILLNIPMLLVISYVQDKAIVLFIKYLTINLLFSLPSLVAICIAQGELRFDRLLYLRVSNNGLFLFFLLVLFLINQATLQNIAYANLLAILSASLIALFAGWTKIQFFHKSSTACVKEIVHFGKFTVGTFISASLFRITDTFIINFMLGPAALAIYSLGQRLMEIVEIPLRSFIATAMPSMSSAYNRGEKTEVIYTMQKYIGMITLPLIPVLLGAFAFSDLAISLIGGGKYVGTEASNVFRLFMTFALLFPADRFFAIGLDVINKPDINFRKVLIMLVINLVADYVGILIFGNVYGITISTLFPTLFAVIIGYNAMQKHYMRFNFWEAYYIGLNELKALIKLSISKKQETLQNH